MALIMAPRGSSKSYVQQSIRAEMLHKKPFPRQCGYPSYSHLQYGMILTSQPDNNSDVSATALNISAHCSNLGDNAINFMLENIIDFIALYNHYGTFLNTYSAEVKYSKLYTMLMTNHIYRDIRGMPNNVPKVLSRKFIKIKQEIIEYLDGMTTGISSVYYSANVHNLCQEITKP